MLNSQSRMTPRDQLLRGWSSPPLPAGKGWEWSWQRRVAQPDEVRTGLPAGVSCRTAKMARLEAALLVAGSPLSARKLADAAMLPDVAEVQALIDRLNRAYDQARTPFRAERVAAGYRLMTRPRFAPWLDRLHQRPARIKLSLPALETLTVVALKQPITRADLEAIRGVQSTEILKQLMDRGLVKIVGEEDSLGRPYLYGTTALFLEQFGLRSLAELPAPERLTPQESLTSRPGLLASPAPSAGEEDTRAGGGEPSFSTDRAA